MSAPDPATDKPQQLDAVYVHARREAIEILTAWAVAMAWTVGYCAVFGYGVKADKIELLFGIPAWVFWGVVVPWLAASAFTVYFSLVRMKLDPIGEQESPISAATGKEG